MKHICTIIAKNYISFARTLCASFMEHNPNGKCYVLIIDEFDGYIDSSKENFEIINLQELKIPRLQEFCFKYNITELSTAVKPYLLQYLFDSRGIDIIFYMDPDILVTSPLDQLYNELETFDILLTPHLDQDYPEDGLKPNDAWIMLSGIYNLGFIGLRKSQNTQRFLSWWQFKLYNKCVSEHASGYFVDQRFIDLASVLFSNIKIIRDRGYNVAYWNIHSREIHKQNNVWMCNDGILYFFHFSGYKLENSNRISVHQNRFNLINLPGLNELFLHYSDLLKYNGYEITRQWPYSYRCYTNKRIINKIDRKVYRKMMLIICIKNPFILKDHPIRLRINIFKDKILNIIFQVVKKFQSIII